MSRRNRSVAGASSLPSAASDDAVAPRAVDRDEPARDVGRHLLGRTLERIAPAAAAPGVEMQHVAGLDMDAVAFGGDVLARAVLAHQRLG